MSEYISRFDSNGKSIVNKIYMQVENNAEQFVQAVEIADGRRLDQYADFYYKNGLNYWIIAAASGIRWPLGIGLGTGNKIGEIKNGTVLFIPKLSEVILLKQ